MGDSHVGLQARLMSQALRKMTGALNNSGTTTIFINQLREKIGVMFGSPGDHDRWQGAEVLRLGPPRRAPHRDPQGRHRRGRQPHPGQGRQEQGGPAVQAGRVRHHVRQGHQPRGRPDRRRRRGGHRPQGRRLVHLRGRPARPGQGERARVPARQPRPGQRDREEDPREARRRRRAGPTRSRLRPSRSASTTSERAHGGVRGRSRPSLEACVPSRRHTMLPPGARVDLGVDDAWRVASTGVEAGRATGRAPPDLPPDPGGGGSGSRPRVGGAHDPARPADRPRPLPQGAQRQARRQQVPTKSQPGCSTGSTRSA